MLDVNNVRFSYDGKSGDEFCFNLKAEIGEILVVEGPSGVGKSTLLNLIAGFLTPSQGNISWQGESILPLAPSARPLSMIFQDNNLFDHLTCRENIALGLNPSLKLDPAEWAKIDAAMEQLHISPLKDRLPHDTSGGQQQRVALARGLVRAEGQARNLLLFDEPFSALDPATRQDCIDAVLQLMASGKMVGVMVSHDPQDAVALNARVHQL